MNTGMVFSSWVIFKSWLVYNCSREKDQVTIKQTGKILTMRVMKMTHHKWGTETSSEANSSDPAGWHEKKGMATTTVVAYKYGSLFEQ